MNLVGLFFGNVLRDNESRVYFSYNPGPGVSVLLKHLHQLAHLEVARLPAVARVGHHVEERGGGAARGAAQARDPRRGLRGGTTNDQSWICRDMEAATALPFSIRFASFFVNDFLLVGHVENLVRSTFLKNIEQLKFQ